MSELDTRVHCLLAAGQIGSATTLVLRELGPEVYGFLSGVLSDADADEVFSALSERLWRSLSGFEGRCAIRTWTYVLARHEIGRFRKGVRRHEAGRVPISEFKEVLEAARTRSRSMMSELHQQFVALRDALPEEDRTVLILRLDRDLSWDEIALAFSETPEDFSDVDRRREAARLRKRFQLVKQRLLAQIRAKRANQIK